MAVLSRGQITISNLVDGKISHTYQAWADGIVNGIGSVGFSLTDSIGKKYTGFYSDFNEQPSNDPTKYSWVETSNAIEQEIAYAWSPDGKDRFTRDKPEPTQDELAKDYDNAVPRYIGRSLKDSNDPSDYTWEVNSERKPEIAWANSADGVTDFTDVKPETNMYDETNLRFFWNDGNGTYFTDKTSYPYVTTVKAKTEGVSFNIAISKNDANVNVIGEIYTIYFEYRGNISNFIIENGNVLYKNADFSKTYEDWTQVRIIFKARDGGNGERFVTSSVDGFQLRKIKFGHADKLSVYTAHPNYNLEHSVLKYKGISNINSTNPVDYVWSLNPDWLEVNTETIVTDKYSQSVQDLDGFKNTVGATYQTKDAMTGYYNKAETNSQINQKAGEITSTVNSTYTTKSDFNTGINNAATDATTKANNALASAKTDATNKANDAKTQAISAAKTETTSQVKQLSDSITSTVSSTYATIKAVEKVSDENGENQWLCNKYNNHNVRKVLTEEDIADLTVDETFTIKDADKFSFDGDYFWLHMCTYLYVSESKTFEMKAIQDDGLSISINNSYVYKTSVTTNSFSSPFSIVLNKGWNKVDIYFNELSGGATFSLSSAFLSLSDRMNCFVSLQNETVSEYKMARLKQDLSGFQLGVSETYETKQNVATNLNTAKSYADTQANSAKASAISTASTDATTKANDAKTAAITESKEYTNSQLEITANSITSTVSATYETKTNVANNLNTAKSYADTQANNAKNSAISTASGDATTKANNAKTAAVSESKTYTDAQLKITSDSITSTISKMTGAGNLVAKSTFEDGQKGNWTSGSVESTVYKPDDTPSKMSRLLQWSTRDNYEDQWFDIKAGETYYFEAYLSAYSANYPVRFGMHMMTADGTNEWQTRASVAKGTTLQLVSGEYTVPSGSKMIKARPFLQIDGGSDFGIARAVGMRIENVTVAYSKIQQTAESIKSTVSANYTTQNDFDSLKNKTDWRVLYSVQDLNNLTTTGKYWLQVASNSNAPTTSWIYVTVDAPQSNRIKQTVQQDSSVSGYWERTYNGSWSGWRKMSDESWVSSQIEQTANSINSTVSQKVGKSEVISTINQSAESVTINASKINLQGALTISQFSTSDRDKINNGISTANTANSAAGTAQSKADSAYNLANTANGIANTANNQVNSWSVNKNNKTYIDGGNVYVNNLSTFSEDLGTVKKGTINGVTINSYNSNGNQITLDNGALYAYNNSLKSTTYLSPSGMINNNSDNMKFYLDFTTQGMSMRADNSNTGLARNVGMDMYGDNTYIDFHNAIVDDRDSPGRIWLKNNEDFEIVNNTGKALILSSKFKNGSYPGNMMFYVNEVHVKNNQNSSNYSRVFASSFSQQSAYSTKTDFENVDTKDLLKAVNDTEVVKWIFKSDKNIGKTKKTVGFVINDNGKSPYMIDPLIPNEDGSSFDTTNLVGILMGAIKELSKKNKELEAKIDTFNELIKSIDIKKLQ